MRRSMEKIGTVSSTVGGKAPQTGRFSNQFIDQLKKLNEWEIV